MSGKNSTFAHKINSIMKKSVALLLFILFSSGMSYAWKPLFVGHRGSDRGVENTAEAYIEGVTYYGCDGLECDVQVTSDGEFVLCHDSKLDNYGHPGVVISSKTLAQLKELTLSQTRNGIHYTGKICTLEEYLQICKQYNVFPVIELKGATGLSSGSMAKFPEVYQLIQKYGLEDVTYIISFMDKAVQHVRQNYPRLKCQRLYMNQVITDADIDWCVENDINPSIDISYKNWDIHTVKRFKNAGLEVATWTINDLGTYKEFVLDRGCYMSSGDCVKKSAAQEGADIDWANVPDYAEKLSPFYVTPLDSFPAAADTVVTDSIKMKVARHTLLLYKSGKRGGFGIRDISAPNSPILHSEASFLPTTQETEGIGFTVKKIDEATYHIYEFADGVGIGGWYVSNAAPQYAAESVTLSLHDVTVAVGDTVVITAEVLPERATGDVNWRVDQARAITLKRESRQVQLIAKSVCEATLTATIDGQKDVCSIHVVKTTDDPQITKENSPSVYKYYQNGRIHIHHRDAAYRMNGTRQ